MGCRQAPVYPQSNTKQVILDKVFYLSVDEPLQQAVRAHSWCQSDHKGEHMLRLFIQPPRVQASMQPHHLS